MTDAAEEERALLLTQKADIEAALRRLPQPPPREDITEPRVNVRERQVMFILGLIIGGFGIGALFLLPAYIHAWVVGCAIPFTYIPANATTITPPCAPEPFLIGFIFCVFGVLGCVAPMGM